MKESSCYGVLVKQTDLANDDAILEFFTDKLGLVTVFVKKFNRSQKRKAEIDFFRLLELELFRGRSSYSLRGARTHTVFHALKTNYRTMEMGFQCLKMFEQTLAHEKVVSEFFTQILDIWTHFTAEDTERWLAFFGVKCLQAKGECPHLDQIRGEMYYDLVQKKSLSMPTPHTVHLSNLDRQVFEFLRRSRVDEFEEKMAKLPLDSVQNLLPFIEQLMTV